jgi:hypothetical protein
MKAVEFKQNIKAIKESLRGLTIQMITKYSTESHKTLKSFGNSILKQESFGYEFNVSRAWTNDGIVSIKNFNDLIELLKTDSVKAIQVCTNEPYNGFGDLVRSYSLD